MQHYAPAELYFRATLAQVRPQPKVSSTLQDLVDILSGMGGGCEDSKGAGWLAVPGTFNESRLAV
jgi:hypothetical protein